MLHIPAYISIVHDILKLISNTSNTFLMDVLMSFFQSGCAMPGARAGTHEKDCGLHCYPGKDQWSYIFDSYAGPWCFCKDPVSVR